MLDQNLLAAGARTLGLELSPAQLDQFARYADRLIEWNARFNLTTITQPREIVSRHFLDSLSTARSIPIDARRLIDVGMHGIQILGSSAEFFSVTIDEHEALARILVEEVGKAKRRVITICGCCP